MHLPEEQAAHICVYWLLGLAFFAKGICPHVVQLFERVFSEFGHYFLKLRLLTVDTRSELASERVRLLTALAVLTYYLVCLFT